MTIFFSTDRKAYEAAGSMVVIGSLQYRLKIGLERNSSKRLTMMLKIVKRRLKRGIIMKIMCRKLSIFPKKK
jgi:hypothetical protein